MCQLMVESPWCNFRFTIGSINSKVYEEAIVYYSAYFLLCRGLDWSRISTCYHCCSPLLASVVLSLVFSSAGEGNGGWTSSTVLFSLIIGLVALVLLTIRQLKMKSPLLDLRAFKYPMFAIGALIVSLCMMVILSSMLVLPMYLQGSLAFSTLSVSLILLPASALNGLLAPIMCKFYPPYASRELEN